MRVFGTYKNEYVRVTGATAANNLSNAFKSGTTSSLTLAWQWDKRDNRLFAAEGWFLSASAELAPPVLAPASVFGNQVNLFTRYAADLRAYRKLWWDVVAKAKLTLGLIRGWHRASDVAISENFYLGGINSVRGYRFLSLAPQRTVFCGTGNVAGPTCEVAVGGNKQLILNLELEFPLFQSAGIRGVLFADGGNAFEPGQWHDPKVNLSLYKSVGFGFRWFSPIGPLRFEWGIPLDRRKNSSGAYIDQAMDFQFTIGNFF
jgi:outer membrane protein insertion porin family